MIESLIGQRPTSGTLAGPLGLRVLVLGVEGCAGSATHASTGSACPAPVTCTRPRTRGCSESPPAQATAGTSSWGITGWIMRELQIKRLPTRRRPHGKRLAEVVSFDLLRWSFRRDRPDKPRLTDITEYPTRERSCPAAWSWTRSAAAWSDVRSAAPRPRCWSSTRRDGHLALRAPARTHHPLGPRRVVRLLGVQPSGARRRDRNVDACAGS